MGRLKKKTTKKQNTKRVFIPDEFRLSRRLLEDASQFVGLPFLLSLVPSWFFRALANEATGGQFFSGSRVKQSLGQRAKWRRWEEAEEKEGSKEWKKKEKKSRRDHFYTLPPSPTDSPGVHYPGDITHARPADVVLEY